jgi:hypothetical protein
MGHAFAREETPRAGRGYCSRQLWTEHRVRNAILLRGGIESGVGALGGDSAAVSPARAHRASRQTQRAHSEQKRCPQR